MNKSPQWIVARLDDDFNWWLESTSLDEQPPSPRLSVLDPRQVTHFVQLLEEYRLHGLRPEQFEAAFTLFTLQSEIDDGRVRLNATTGETLGDGSELFAVPVIDEDGDGPYFDFLDAIIAARIHKLNTSHGYVHDCTPEELIDELALLDADRYFSEETRHCFDEITEILEWSPAEWGDPSES